METQLTTENAILISRPNFGNHSCEMFVSQNIQKKNCISEVGSLKKNDEVPEMSKMLLAWIEASPDS